MLMSIIGIAAVAQNLAIGKDGKLPWHYSSDLKHFKKTTTGNTVVMGYNTWKSIGKALPNRLNVVMSRSKSIEYQSRVLVLRNIEDAIVLSNYINGDMFVIGGTQTYMSFAHAIEKWIVTEIPEVVKNADAFISEDFLDGFESVEVKELKDGLNVRTFLRT